MSFTLIVADESVDGRIIEALQKEGFNIEAISSVNPGISDTEVIAFAVKKKAFILTEDKDFGDEIVYRKAFHEGALLLRLAGMPVDQKIVLVLNTLRHYENELRNAFSVLNNKKLRVRK